MKQKAGAGFTLIEVLVVIAIIGILTAIIILGISRSRAKASDTRVESSLRQLRVLAEDFYIANSFSYAGWDICMNTPSSSVCRGQSLSTNVTTLKAEIQDATNNQPLTAHATKNDFCMSTPLVFDETRHICTTAAGELTTDKANTPPPCLVGPPPRCVF